MREAVRILSLEGLVKRNIHRGIAVARLSLNDVHEICRVRRLLEIQAILSAKKPDPTCCASCVPNLNNMKKRYAPRTG
jgi:DNA-binding GntR family transcriptional regulator